MKTKTTYYNAETTTPFFKTASLNNRNIQFLHSRIIPTFNALRSNSSAVEKNKVDNLCYNNIKTYNMRE